MARLSLFCKPHPDELFFSVLSRSYCFQDELQFKRALFQQKFIKKGFLPLFPVPYDRLVRVLPPNFITQEDFLERHSVFPFYEQFCPADSYRRAIKVALKGGRGTGSMFQNARLHFCPACVGEDKDNGRTPYLRSLHQVKGYVVCHRHKTKVQILKRVGTFETPMAYSLDSLTGLDSTPSDDTFTDAERILSEDIASSREAFSGLTRQQIWDGLLDRCHGTDHTANMSEDLKQKVIATLDALPDFGQDVVKTGVSIWQHKSSFRRHALGFATILIRCMGESPSSFAQLVREGRTKLTFHPCPNPSCPDFEHEVVPDDRRFLPESGFYVFTCPTCDYAFAKLKKHLRWSDRIYPYSLGPKTDEFKKLWADPQVTTESIRERFGLTSNSFIYLAYFQGLQINRMPKFARMVSRAIEKRRSTLMRDRVALSKAFAENPRSIVNQAEASDEIRRLLQRLQIRDPEFVHEYLVKAKQDPVTGQQRNKPARYRDRRLVVRRSSDTRASPLNLEKA